MRKTFLCSMLLGGAIAAAPLDSTLQQTATRQEQIRGEAELLVSRLDEVLADYAHNGIARGEDYQSLKDVRATLGTLSEQEMEHVVQLLRQSAGSPEGMAKAYAGQKDISLRLKQILADHQRQQDIDALARAVKQLADRQSSNLSVAIDARQLGAQDHSATGVAAVAASQQAQHSEQGAIAAEVKLLSVQLVQIATEPKQKEAAAELDKVQPEAVAASNALGAGRLDDAVDAEKSARAQLEEVAAALIPAGEPAPAQNQDAGQLADLVRQERALLAQTTALSSVLQKTLDAETPEATDKAMYEQIKLPSYDLSQKLFSLGVTPSSPVDQIRNAAPMKGFLDARAAALKRQEQTLQPELAALATTQAALASKAQMVREDLQKTTKEADVPMANALTQMNSAQEALAESDGEQATQDEMDAATQLDQAQRLAEAQQSASAPAPAAPGDKDQQTRDLMNGVHQLAAREQQAIQQDDAAKTGPMAVPAAELQQNLAGRAQALVQSATEQAPSAAQPLQQAADAFQNAAQAMQNGMNAAAAKAQQNAVDALAQATRQLTQQAVNSAQQKRDLAAMERQMSGLDRLIQEQQQVGADTTAAATAGQPAQPWKAKQLAARQAMVRRETQAARKALDTVTPDAAKALDRADIAMGEAAQKLADHAGAEAQPPQKDALTALYQAQDALANKMQSLAQQTGEPAAHTPDADQELAKAAEEAGAAQSTMAAPGAGEAETQAAASQLTQAAHSAAQAGAQPQNLPQGARDAIRNAQQALAGAASAARGGNQQQAQAQAGQAAQALAAAQSAMGEAQAGIAGLAPQQPGEGQGSQSATMGQGKDAAKEKSWKDQAGAATAAAGNAHGAGQYIGLPDRDRAAIQQSQSEKYPQEYGAMIEEYMRSLASDSGGK